MLLVTSDKCSSVLTFSFFSAIAVALVPPNAHAFQTSAAAQRISSPIICTSTAPMFVPSTENPAQHQPELLNLVATVVRVTMPSSLVLDC